MPHVKSIVSRKDSSVLGIGPDASVLEAATLMNRHSVGALLILDPDTDPPRLLGIFTERDVLRRVVGEQRDPAATAVRDVMTSDVVVCQPETELDAARMLFKQRRIRHLPVVDQANAAVAVISIGDLNAWDLDGQEIKIQALEQYIYGPA